VSPTQPDLTPGKTSKTGSLKEISNVWEISDQLCQW